MKRGLVYVLTSPNCPFVKIGGTEDGFVKVDEIAALACWLASEDCSFSTGAVFDISGGRATY